MVDYTPNTRPGEQDRPHEYVRETTVVKTGSSNGVMAAVVLFVLLAVAGFVFWSADESVTVNSTAPAAINEQVAPDPAAEPARPVPAPDVPAEIAPAETTPAPAVGG